jgi:hypothetical protein
MSNHALASENSDEFKFLYQNDNHDNQNLINIKGGAIENMTKDKPTGGFPPIYIIDESKEKEAEKNKNRQLTSTKTAVSIKDILKSKK